MDSEHRQPGVEADGDALHASRRRDRRDGRRSKGSPVRPACWAPLGLSAELSTHPLTTHHSPSLHTPSLRCASAFPGRWRQAPSRQTRHAGHHWLLQT